MLPLLRFFFFFFASRMHNRAVLMLSLSSIRRVTNKQRRCFAALAMPLDFSGCRHAMFFASVSISFYAEAAASVASFELRLPYVSMPLLLPRFRHCYAIITLMRAKALLRDEYDGR